MQREVYKKNIDKADILYYTGVKWRFRNCKLRKIIAGLVDFTDAAQYNILEC